MNFIFYWLDLDFTCYSSFVQFTCSFIFKWTLFYWGQKVHIKVNEKSFSRVRLPDSFLASRFKWINNNRKYLRGKWLKIDVSPDKQKKMLELVWTLSLQKKMCVQIKSFVFSLATLTTIFTIKVAKLNLSVDMTKKSQSKWSILFSDTLSSLEFVSTICRTKFILSINFGRKKFYFYDRRARELERVVKRERR